MQTVLSTPTEAIAARPVTGASVGANLSAYVGYQIIRRNGAVVSFEPNKIAVALMKAFLAEIGRAHV